MASELVLYHSDSTESLARGVVICAYRHCKRIEDDVFLLDSVFFSLGEDAEKDLNTATGGGKPYYEDDPTALFTVAAFSENEGSFYDLSGYRYLKSDNGYNYYCRIYPEGKKSGITKDTIKKILIT